MDCVRRLIGLAWNSGFTRSQRALACSQAHNQISRGNSETERQTIHSISDKQYQRVPEIREENERERERRSRSRRSPEQRAASDDDAIDSDFGARNWSRHPRGSSESGAGWVMFHASDVCAKDFGIKYPSAVSPGELRRFLRLKLRTNSAAQPEAGKTTTCLGVVSLVHLHGLFEGMEIWPWASLARTCCWSPAPGLRPVAPRPADCTGAGESGRPRTEGNG